jgi:ATP-binding cassette subfamily C protein
MMDTPLARHFAVSGTACEARSGSPLPLLDADGVWLVAAGKVDVFLTKWHDGRPGGALHPLFRVETGQVLFGLGKTASIEEWMVVAVGVPGTRLLRLDRNVLRLLLQQDDKATEETADLLDDWLARLAAPGTAKMPGSAILLSPAVNLVVATPGQVFLAHQQTCWVCSTEGEWLLGGNSALPLPKGSEPFPLPRRVSIESTTTGAMAAVSSGDFLRGNHSWKNLDRYSAIVLAGLIADAEAGESSERQRLTRKSANEQQHMRDAMVRLSAILDNELASKTMVNSTRPLLAACRLVGRSAGIDFVAPPGGENDATHDVLDEIVEASRLRRRTVALKGDWWRHDCGHMLGYLEEGRHPVALLRTANGYQVHDPMSESVQSVDATVAASLRPFAFVFYRSFGSALVTLGSMLKFGSHGNLPDYLMALCLGIAIGLLGMVTPLVTGLLFDTVIPGAERGQLLQLTLALLAGAFASTMFEVTRGFVMLRAEGKMDTAVQAAVWDRLLRLPMPFFRDYSAGDLAMRANGINTIRQVVSGTTLHTLMSAVFSIFNLVLLFYYSLKLALLGIALVAVAMIFTIATSYLRLHHERRLAEIEGQISGLVFQFLGGVAKLRTTGAESRAFLNWAMLFARQQEHQFKATMVGNALTVFNAVFPTAAGMSIFAAIAFVLNNDTNFSTGTFLAFNAAFGSFLGAMLGATAALGSVLDVVPIYERAKPILQTPPEIAEGNAYPGELIGDIEISHLSFRYGVDGPSVLRDISVRIEPGEFVALVGPSGSGKSTLLRLLLGFETPTTGAIYYDRQDMRGLDLAALRRQLGVVLQSGQLLSGDIFANIIGSSANLTLDDAWVAATQAGIAEDIRAMPMGMHTVVSDGGGTLSGGQRQRLLIARAIVNRPRILFFDEATSALDNRTQDLVSASLESLRATRIVIAHRLSTIVNADRILVLDGGQLVQSGTYDELVNSEGLFADLAKRQIA